MTSVAAPAWPGDAAGRRAGQNLLPVDPGPSCKGAEGHHNCPTLTASFSWSFKAQTIASVPAWLLRGSSVTPPWPLPWSPLWPPQWPRVRAHLIHTLQAPPDACGGGMSCSAAQRSRLSGKVGRLSSPPPPSAVSLRQQLPLAPGLCALHQEGPWPGHLRTCPLSPRCLPP